MGQLTVIGRAKTGALELVDAFCVDAMIKANHVGFYGLHGFHALSRFPSAPFFAFFQAPDVPERSRIPEIKQLNRTKAFTYSLCFTFLIGGVEVHLIQ